jgi:SagB-type dehydrogenase family enzyme
MIAIKGRPLEGTHLSDYLEALPEDLSRLCEEILELCGTCPISVERLEHSVIESRRPERPLFWYALDLLAKVNLTDAVIMAGDHALITVVGANPATLPPSPQDRPAVSPFTRLRPTPSGWMLETPFRTSHLLLTSHIALAFLAHLIGDRAAGSGTEFVPDELGADVREEMIQAVQAVGALDFHHHGFDQWDYHDLFFHARTRGLMPGHRGGTYRFLGRRTPEPALPTRHFGAALKLPEMTPTKALSELYGVLADRRSLRSYGSEPITAAQLGTFLRNVAQVTAVGGADPDHGLHYETVLKLHPGGGACHELEIYPVVNRCAGLEPGMYWYDAARNRLELVSTRSATTDRIIERAGHSMGIFPNTPDVLLCIAARFSRVNWKYEGIAYATILKNVGVLMHSMYLVATSLELAPCAVGAGDSADFSVATGNFPAEEDAVGEFALGSRVEGLRP